MPSSRVFIAGSLLLLASVAVAGETRPDSQIELGRKLFEQGWLRPPADDSPLALAPGGDGLGPLYNAGSCVDCHRLGGTGGAGPNENNVDVISVALPFGIDEQTRAATLRRSMALHPAFREKPHVILHRFGRGRDGAFDIYAAFREDILERFPDLPRPAAETEIEVAGVPFQRAQRNTTAMFGAGVIDQVPPAVLVGVAEWQKANHPEQAGRASLGGRGRFGWRGQVDSLATFVRMACADECGLRVRSTSRRIQEQAAWPIRDRESTPDEPRGTDLTEEQVDALVAFSASLPAPQPVLSNDPSAADAGRRLFDQVGCAVCHVEHLGPARHIYSDLLLHNLGRPLADRVKAPPATADIRTVSAPVGYTVMVGYYDERPAPPITRTIVKPPSLNDFEMTTQEWKTPPLWGVADSAPYLHDGRAETLDDAIRLHGGQAAPSAENYAALPSHEQKQLLAFLGTLRAPREVSSTATASREDKDQPE
jgi:CxxC motif-containing protein (DUF1111 family)